MKPLTIVKELNIFKQYMTGMVFVNKISMVDQFRLQRFARRRLSDWPSSRTSLIGKKNMLVTGVSTISGTDQCRMTWAALIKAVKKETVLCTGVFTLQEQRDNCVYEVDPLKCPNCGGTMKVISFIERNQPEVIEKILRHCDLWKETPTRAPPVELPVPPQQFAGPTLDFAFFESLAS